MCPETSTSTLDEPDISFSFGDGSLYKQLTEELIYPVEEQYTAGEKLKFDEYTVEKHSVVGMVFNFFNKQKKLKDQISTKDLNIENLKYHGSNIKYNKFSNLEPIENEFKEDITWIDSSEPHISPSNFYHGYNPFNESVPGSGGVHIQEAVPLHVAPAQPCEVTTDTYGGTLFAAFSYYVPQPLANPFLAANKDPFSLFHNKDQADNEGTIPVIPGQLHIDYMAAEGGVENIDNPLTAQKLRESGFVKRAPKFTEITEVEGRTNVVQYRQYRIDIHGTMENEVETTIEEGQGLRQMAQFLGAVASKDELLIPEKIRNFADELTYIGDKELDEAVQGIAAYWLDYLDGDSSRQLCITTKISSDCGIVKSDSYVLERALEAIGGKRLSEYRGRILTDPRYLSAKPKDAKIVVLDDWILSGSSLRQAVGTILQDSNFPFEYRQSLEVNVLAASEERIEGGLDYTGDTIPIKAYYKAHHADTEYKVRISGSHSSSDYGYEDDIVSFVQNHANELLPEITSTPPLIRITRPYRDMVLLRKNWLSQLAA